MGTGSISLVAFMMRPLTPYAHQSPRGNWIDPLQQTCANSPCARVSVLSGAGGSLWALLVSAHMKERPTLGISAHGAAMYSAICCTTFSIECVYVCVHNHSDREPTYASTLAHLFTRPLCTNEHATTMHALTSMK